MNYFVFFIFGKVYRLLETPGSDLNGPFQVFWAARNLQENAMVIILEPKTSYNLISRRESSNNKLLVQVKLTDSCLRGLEENKVVEVIF